MRKRADCIQAIANLMMTPCEQLLRERECVTVLYYLAKGKVEERRCNIKWVEQTGQY